MTRTGAPARLGALELVEMVVDAGSFVRWDTDPLPPIGVHGPADQGYLDELAAARRTSGCDESVLTGEATLAGRRVALVLCEFGFLAGSIGTAAAERLVQAVEKATAEQLPLLASPTSGGTRMQEGTVAFLQMVKISAAIAAHKSAGLAYAVYLRHPTTGGALASWGSLGHVTAAEPGALLGFLGPRVYQALYGEKFPEGVQTAENLAARGLVDAWSLPNNSVRLPFRPSPSCVRHTSHLRRFRTSRWSTSTMCLRGNPSVVLDGRNGREYATSCDRPRTR